MNDWELRAPSVTAAEAGARRDDSKAAPPVRLSETVSPVTGTGPTFSTVNRASSQAPTIPGLGKAASVARRGVISSVPERGAARIASPFTSRPEAVAVKSTRPPPVALNVQRKVRVSPVAIVTVPDTGPVRSARSAAPEVAHNVAVTSRTARDPALTTA